MPLQPELPEEPQYLVTPPLLRALRAHVGSSLPHAADSTPASELLSIEAASPAQLAERFDHPHVHRAIWRELEYSLPQNVEAADLRTLVRLLAVYQPESDESWARVVASLLESAIKQSDESIIEILGAQALQRELSDESVLECAIALRDFQTHNINHHRGLDPWIQLLSERGSATVTECFVDEVRERISKGHRASSDLLVAILRNRQDPDSREKVQELVKELSQASSRQDDLGESFVEQSLSFVVELAPGYVGSVLLCSVCMGFLMQPAEWNVWISLLTGLPATAVYRYLRRMHLGPAEEMRAPKQFTLTQAHFAAQDMLEALQTIDEKQAY
jgi:hypothetical protein